MILELHGSIDSPNHSILSHRRMLTRNKLLDWAAAQRRFVSVGEAFLGEGIAVTIDDGTYAAYETALALRGIGHEVTVYINMLNVLTRRNYFFHRLNALLDKFFEIKTTEQGVDLTISEKEEWRSQIKKELMKISEDTKCSDYLESFRKRHSIEFDFRLPRKFQCIGIDECKEMVARGVNLGNHCFDHLNPAAKGLDDFEKGADENADLLKSWFNAEDNFCAIPFGKWQPPFESCQERYVWLLADQARPIGHLSEYVFNRRSIDCDADLESLGP